MLPRVNTPSSSFSRAGVGVFSTVLAAALLLIVGALLSADRALASASGEAAAIDAQDCSHLLEQLLARRVDALSSLSSASQIAREASASVSTSEPVPTTTQIELARGASGTDIIVRVPAVVDGHRAAIAVRFEAKSLFAEAVKSAPKTRARFVLVASGDTILESATAADRPSLTWRHADVHVPGATWQLSVAHADTGQALRFTLWTLGLIAVILLGGGVLRERRQAIRVAERSAELERLSSELLRANRMKSEFLANVSHELRTPLNAIVGFVDLLRDGVYGDLSTRQAPPVERIAASATHLRHLVDQVLDIAKIAAGRLEVHAETIVLRPFVLNVVSELEPLINERGLNLSIAVGASLPRVRTDPTHLRQILVNLIGNAIKYTPAGGIAVRARLAGQASVPGVRNPSPEDPTLLSRSPDRRKTWIALQVIDTGIGISPVDQERIFDEFEQVNAGPRGDSMERGTGLGLAISRRLARLLGGEISVESQTGKGSTFTIWLPVSPADIQAEPSEPTPAAQQAAV